MNDHRTEIAAIAVDYIEGHLDRELNLDILAKAARYSKYHLHRIFTDLVGLPPCGYIQRRRLTEAARLLVSTRRPILELALEAGYESQQAFTSAFRAMYKQPPKIYREKGFFYPLQLAFSPRRLPVSPAFGTWRVITAAPEDLPRWMDFIPLVIGGFPRLDRAAHRAEMQVCIAGGQVLLLEEGDALLGGAVFSRETGHIHLLAAHPQRRQGAEALLDRVTRSLPPGRIVSITTFRAGDRADTGQRAAYRRLGFVEAELLTEYGYPTQRLILPPKGEVRRDG